MAAQEQWHAANGTERVEHLPTTASAHWRYDREAMKRLEQSRPWRKDPTFFKRVRISSLAVIKMLMHAKTGHGKAGVISSDANNWVEVMGLTQGYYTDYGTFVVTDTFALPVDATEVECVMNDAAIVYMFDYLDNAKVAGRGEGAVGWYHSHPGYTCYLSGTDVRTQCANQQGYGAFVAFVIDPVRTLALGKVELKAFMTYPEGFTLPASEGASDAAVLPTSSVALPSSRTAEFGAHAHRYYELPITIFRSEADQAQLDQLWNKYWMKTLSTSPLIANRFFTDQQIVGVSECVESAQREDSHHRDVPRSSQVTSTRGNAARADSKALRPPAASLVALSARVGALSTEVLQGTLSMIVKDSLFNARVCEQGASAGRPPGGTIQPLPPCVADAEK